MESREDRITRIAYDHNISDKEAERIADSEIRFLENKDVRASLKRS